MVSQNTSMSQINTNPITLTRHIIQGQQQYEAHGDFTILLTAIQTACKFVSSKVRKAGIANLYGASGGENVTGDKVKKLDIISNDAFINILKGSGKTCAMISEENEDVIKGDKEAKYIVSFDPLDGSSNIDANISIGSIFGIWKRISDCGDDVTEQDYLQKGENMIAAGYCCYGSATQFVLSCGEGVNIYTLDNNIGEFILTHENVQCKEKGVIYSINEGNSLLWHDAVKEYIHSKKFPTGDTKPYSLRYVGSMVADVNRTLLYGGIFLYPGDKKSINGKLRVLYECFPMAYLVEKAGGKAITGTQRILELEPKTIHERCPVIIGSNQDVTECEGFFKSKK